MAAHRIGGPTPCVGNQEDEQGRAALATGGDAIRFQVLAKPGPRKTDPPSVFRFLGPGYDASSGLLGPGNGVGEWPHPSPW